MGADVSAQARPRTPEEATAESAAVFCFCSAEEKDRRENRGASWAERHSVGAGGRFPNLPSLLTFFWAQRSPWTEVAQNWHKLPQCCQAQALVYRGQSCFVLTSLPVFDSKGGGSLTDMDAVYMWHHLRTAPSLLAASRIAGTLGCHYLSVVESLI